MKILIATGIYPPDVGGPAYYAKSLCDEFVKLGHMVKVLKYTIEKNIPSGLRHIVFFLKTVLHIRGVDFIIALDTFSIGFPVVVAGKLFSKKIIIRSGGDFLWESYIARTRERILFSEFYKKKRAYSLKEKIIFILTKFSLKNADAVVFSTDWQREIFINAYGLNRGKTFVVENFYGEKRKSVAPKEKNFLWAGRDIVLKNLNALREAFRNASKKNRSIRLDLSEKVSREKLLEKIKQSYAIILPSVSEISPNFVLEALMYNKPFLVTKDTGLRDKLKDVGIFVDPLDVLDIEEKILFLSDDNNYTRFKNNISSFRFTHSYKEIAEEFIEVSKKI